MGYIEVQNGNSNGIPQSGVGYIIVPSGSDRSEYITRCYRTHTVSINGGLGCSNMHNVKITDTALRNIKFPNDLNETGTPVVWIRESFYNRPIVIDTLTVTGDTSFGTDAHQAMAKSVGDQSAGVHVDGGGVASLSADGGTNAAGAVNIKAVGSNGTAVNIESTDQVNESAKTLNVTLTKDYHLVIDDQSDPDKKQIIILDADATSIHFKDHWDHEMTLDEKKIELKDKFKRVLTLDEEKTEYQDAFDNKLLINKDETHYTDNHKNEVIMNDDHTQFKCSKFDIGDGAEPIVLGQTLVDTLGKLCDAIKAITVQTPHGPSSTPINAGDFSSIKSNLKTILSQLSNTD